MGMSIERAGIVAILAMGIAWSAPARADNAMQVCGAKYQAAKKANTLPAGQTWNQFLAACRASLPKPAGDAAPTRKAAAKAPKTPKVPGQLSAAQTAEHSRIKQCAAQWQSDKAANKVPAGQTWPKYWSACSARLKG
jgi:hypothetical protein